MRFRATLESSGKAGPGIQVPAEVVATLGAGRRPPVRVTIAGHTSRSTITALGERFLVAVNAESRAAAGVTVGDELDVELELDTEPRASAAPRNRDAEPGGGANAQSAFEALSSSPKQRLRSVEDAKTEATRQRRIDRMLAKLRAGGR